MKAMVVLRISLFSLLICTIGTTWAEQTAKPPLYDEASLKQRYDAFLLELDYVKVAADYPKAIKDLLSGDSAKQEAAIKTLGATGEPAVIPWLALFLDSDNKSLQTWAGSSIESVISARALRRRDPTKADRVVLLLPKAGDIDLRPFAWIALKMFRKPDDGSTHAYAASITRYLEIREFEGELRQCLNSRHPAVSTRAKWALESLDFVVNDPARQTPPANGTKPRR